MTSSQQTLENTLRTQGYSVTRPRQIVFDALRAGDTLTMHELTKRCAAQVDRASVYRTVALFEATGIIQRLQIGWKYQLELSDSFQDHHHHATCTTCGKVLPLPENEKLEEQLRLWAQQHGFTAQSHQLEIRGHCTSCQKLANMPDRSE